ncbi:MAG: hypothetical protein M0Z69_10945 [Actinomycetota bacterium]|nr:hypothetical protein [Actinomycetota bacterium]
MALVNHDPAYVMVAELQRRGVVHLQAVVRADAAGEEREPAPLEVTREALAAAFASAEIEELELPDHVRRIVGAAWELGGKEGQERFRRWAHALGFSGHVLTKSRRYSTTFSCLRAERQAWRLTADGEAPPTGAWTWSFMGTGYRKELDRLFARSVAESRREARYARWLERSSQEPWS